MNPPSTANPVSHPTNREWSTIAALTAVAAILRFRGFGRLGLTHFDEGVYALAGLWSVSPRGLAGLDPQLSYYAPPGQPILIGVAYRLFGVSDASALLVSVVVGISTIPLAAWVAKRTFGPGAGAAAAAFAALSLAHTAFSRKAMTDATFLFTWLLAMGLGGRFLEKPRLGRALALGLAVGLAQNVKYQGYLAGLVVALGAVVGLIGSPESRHPAQVARTFGLGLIAALVSAMTYRPWYRFVEVHDGYAALIRHQRSYLRGPGSWYPHWEAQLGQVIALSGTPGWAVLTWAAAWLGAGFATMGLRRIVAAPRWDRARFRVGLLFGGVILILIPDLSWWVGLAWVPWLLADRQPAPRLLGVWWLVLSALTPFYHPYARLWLPIHAAGWVLLAGALVRLGPFSESLLDTPDRLIWTRPAVLARAAMAIVCLVLARVHWGEDAPRPFPWAVFDLPTDNLRVAVAELVQTSSFPTDQGLSLRVLARRPVTFYLTLQGGVSVRLLQDLDGFLAGPGHSDDWALVDDALVGGRDFDASFGPLSRTGWARRQFWESYLDPVTLLDVDPNAARGFLRNDKKKLILFAPSTPATPLKLPVPPTPASGPGPGDRSW